MPTNGTDVGTKAQAHGSIRRLASEGLAILLISSDLPEVLRISDRILVMADGRLTAELAAAEATGAPAASAMSSCVDATSGASAITA